MSNGADSPDEPTGSLGEGRDAGAGGTRSFRTFEPSSTHKAGDAVGPYKILFQIGEGGFGEVWLAERREPFVQRVALKLIKPGMDSKSVIARFEQERQALAVMNHPHIAKVLDGGLTPQGRPYFAMEYVKGEPITEFCDARKLSVKDRLQLFTQACEAVQHAHLKGIVHRDLKPTNILAFDVEGEGPKLKVIDFGVAKAMSQTLTDKTIFTETGQMIGTPAYMSPEQADPTSADIDTRSDIYSLGVLLYELVAGATPFDAKTLRAKAYAEIQRIIREEDPPTPSARLSTISTKDAELASKIEKSRGVALRELARELRSELEWIPLKAMRKEPRNRYQTAIAFAEDVRAYLDGKPITAAPESTGYRVRKYVRRNRAVVLGVAAVTTALVVGAGFTTWQWRSAVESERRAVEATRTAREAGDAAHAKADELARKNAEIEVNSYVANVQLASYAMREKDLILTRRRLGFCAPRLRGWEWAWMDAQLDNSESVHRLPIERIVREAVHPDGSMVATVDADGVIRLFDPVTAEVLRTFDKQPRDVLSIQFEAGGRLLAARIGSAVRIFDLAAGGRHMDFGDPSIAPEAWTSFLVNRDGSLLLKSRLRKDGTSGDLWSYVTFEVSTGRELWKASYATSSDWLRFGSGSGYHRFSDDGTRLVLGEHSWGERLTAAIVFDARSGGLIERLEKPGGEDGSLFLSGSGMRAFRIDEAGGAEIAKIPRAEVVSVQTAGAVFHRGDGVTFSPDDRLVLTSTEAGKRRIFESATGRQVAELPRLKRERQHGALFNPEGTRVLVLEASGLRSGTTPSVLARVFETTNGKQLGELDIGVQTCARSCCVRFTSDGMRVWLGRRLWDPLLGSSRVARGALLNENKFGVDRERLVAVADDGTRRLVKVWSLPLQPREGWRFGPLNGLEGELPWIRSLDFDWRVVVKRIGLQNQVRLDGSRWPFDRDEDGGHWHVSMPMGFQSVSEMSLDDRGKFVHRKYRTYDRRTTANPDEPGPDRRDSVLQATFSPNADRIAQVMWDGSVRLSDPLTGQRVAVLRDDTGELVSVAFSPDGERMLTLGTNQRLVLWDPVNGSRVTAFGEKVNRASFTSDGSDILMVLDDDALYRWESGVLRLVRYGDGSQVGVVSPDGSRMLSWSDARGSDETPVLLDAATGQEVAKLQPQGNPYISFACVFSQDGRWIATYDNEESEYSRNGAVVNRSRSVSIWDSATGSHVATLGDGDRLTRFFAFCLDGKVAMTVGIDGRVQVWETDSWRLRSAFGDRIANAALSPRGDRVAAVVGSETIQIWSTDLALPLCELPLDGPAREIKWLDFSADGTCLIALGKDGVAEVFDAVPWRVRCAERRWQGAAGFSNLGARYLDELRGASPATWLSEPLRYRADSIDNP